MAILQEGDKTMDVAIQVPEDVARQLEAKWGDVSQKALESLTLEAYRTGVITEAEVGLMLNLTSRLEVAAFLKRARAYLDYTEADLERDMTAIRQVMP
jgi:Uncharacterised protein family (UPF0175)